MQSKIAKYKYLNIDKISTKYIINIINYITNKKRLMNNFWKTLIMILIGIVIGMSSTSIGNFISNTFFNQNIPSLSQDQQWQAIDKLKDEISDLNTAIWPKKYSKFDEIYDILSENYYIETGSIDRSKMIEWALHWFVWWLDDPHSVYFDAEENQSFNEDLKWNYDFEGIWAVINKRNNNIEIAEVINDSPAYFAWLRPFDIILEIDGKKTDDMSVYDVVNLVRWTGWTQVNLTIYQYKSKNIKQFNITRKKISIPSVTYKLQEYNGKKIWYISISTIWENTASKFKEAINQSQADQVKGLIIDLRWNGWWLLPVAVDIASHFIEKGKMITYTKYNSIPDEQYPSLWYDDIKVPTVILVDELTASASEIIAQALRYHKGIQLIWTKTFGKWSIQTLYDLHDWSSIKFTIWSRYWPDWSHLNHDGIDPDVTIDFDLKAREEKATDNQLEKAKEIISAMIDK